jgi:hypothetical protein
LILQQENLCLIALTPFVQVLAECLTDLKELASFGAYPFGGAAVALLAGKNIKFELLNHFFDNFYRPQTIIYNTMYIK